MASVEGITFVDEIIKFDFKKNGKSFNSRKEFFDCTRCHGGHVGGKNNSENVFWEFDSIIVQNVS